MRSLSEKKYFDVNGMAALLLYASNPLVLKRLALGEGAMYMLLHYLTWATLLSGVT